MKRTGKFTIPNFIGALLLIFLFGAGFPVIKASLVTAMEDANLLSQAAIVLVGIGILYSIGAYIIGSTETPRQPAQPRRRMPQPRPERRPRR